MIFTSFRESATRLERLTVKLRNNIPMSGNCRRCTLATKLLYDKRKQNKSDFNKIFVNRSHNFICFYLHLKRQLNDNLDNKLFWIILNVIEASFTHTINITIFGQFKNGVNAVF